MDITLGNSTNLIIFNDHTIRVPLPRLAHSFLLVAGQNKDVEDEDDGSRDEIEEVGDVDVDRSTVLFWVKVTFILKNVLESRY